jgi:16S rRNA (guanine966-N2)-methyltransferase
VRIVGGALRGRSLAAPRTQSVRPTSDRLRETIFDILRHSFGDPAAGAAVIDLFAGTGALGLEALSRGATRALFIDDGAEARALLRQNIESFGLGGVTRVFRRDATRLGAAPPRERFSLAFLDPPYRKDLAPAALRALHAGGWLTEGAVAMIEEAADATVSLPEAFVLADARKYGDTQILFARYAARASATP